MCLCLIDFYFEFLIHSIAFHFHKEGKTKYSSFLVSFSLRNWKTNCIKTLCLFSRVWFTVYSKASSCKVPWNFPLYSGHADTRNLPFLKTANVFKCLFTGCYFLICFIFIVNCDIKQQKQPSWGVLQKSFHKSFINS